MSTIKVNKILSANNPNVDVADGLTVIIVLLSTNKAFSCKAVNSYLVCRQVKLK